MMRWNRRDFLKTTAAAAAGWTGTGRIRAAPDVPASGGFGADVEALLTDWASALLKLQVRDESKPGENGAFRCPHLRVHGTPPCELGYRLTATGVVLEATVGGPEAGRAATRLVAPVIATRAEKAVRDGDRGVSVSKTSGTVRLTASATPEVEDGLDSRFINYSPGYLALPVAVAPDASGRRRLEIRVET